MPRKKLQGPRLPLVGPIRQGGSGIGWVQGISNLHQRHGGLGFLFTRMGEGDVGVDGLLEIATKSGSATGKLLGVQVKTGDSFFRRDGSGVVYVKKSTREYWREYSVPVILVLCDERGRRLLWVRVDKGEFTETNEHFKIELPAHQKYDAGAASALAAFASQGPPSLLAQAILSPELISENTEVQEALRRAASKTARRTAATRALVFANVLRQRGRVHDAVSLTQRAVRVLHSSGAKARALVCLCELAEWLLNDLRDGHSAHDAIAFGLTSETPPGREIPLPEWPNATRMRLEILRAKAEAMCGSGQRAVETARLLRERAAVSRRRAQGRLIRAALELEFCDALAREDHRAAASASEGVAALAGVSAGEDAIHLLDACLHRGLAGKPENLIEAARMQGVPEAAVYRRYMVLGWLKAESGDFLGAWQEYCDAGSWSLEHHRPEAAYEAFQNAAAMERLAEAWTLGHDGPMMRARDLMPLVAAETTRRATYARLMSEIDSDIGHGSWRTAAINLNMATFRALQDANWLAFQEARARAAALLRGIALETPTREAIIDATRETAATLLSLEKEERERVLTSLKGLVGDRMVPRFAAELWTGLLDGAGRPQGVMGAMKIASALGRNWTLGEKRAEELSGLILKGIGLGWNRIAGESGVAIACELVLALRPAVRGKPAARICDALLNLHATADWVHLHNYFNSIAVTGAAATNPKDGGASIVDKLLSAEAHAREYDAFPQWVGALAMNLRRMTGKPKQTAANVIAARASAAPERGGHEWQAVERAVAAGVVVPAGIGDRYLIEMTRLLGALTRQTRGGGLGGGARDVWQLTQWAARNSSPAVRKKAVQAAIRFLLLEEHLLHERRTWISFIARLARHTPSVLGEAVPALERVANGELLPRGGLMDEFTHPLAFMRVKGHTLTALRIAGLSALGFLMPALPARVAYRVIRVLERAVADPEPELRSEAATAARLTIIQPEVLPTVRAALKRRVIAVASRDHVESVALAGLRRPLPWDDD